MMSAAESKAEARFDALLQRAERGLLDFAQLRELSVLYRIHSTRLSQQRSKRVDPERLRYLNGLCVRAAVHLYAPAARRRFIQLFWLKDLPNVLARTWRVQCLAVLLLALGTVVGARVVLEDGQNVAATVPAQMYDASDVERLYESAEARAAFLERRPADATRNALFAGMLFGNNTRVGLLSFATGVLCAVPTLLLLLYNGLTLGGFGAIFLRGPSAIPFLAWMVPHAIPELLAIILCSAGGISMGLAVLCPGRVGRARALEAAARDAFLLLAVAVPLFVVAALIESYVRESLLSTGARALVAALVSTALLGYVALVVRTERKRRSAPTRFLERQLEHRTE